MIGMIFPFQGSEFERGIPLFLVPAAWKLTAANGDVRQGH